MNKTPLEEYFNCKTSSFFRKKFSILNMEQLMAIAYRPNNLIGLAEAVELTEDELNNILSSAKKHIGIPLPSGRVYF